MARRSKTSRSRGVSRLNGPSRDCRLGQRDPGAGGEPDGAALEVVGTHVVGGCSSTRRAARGPRPGRRGRAVPRPGSGAARGRSRRRTAPPVRSPPELGHGRFAGVPGGVGLGERELDPVVRRAPFVGEPACADANCRAERSRSSSVPTTGCRASQAEGLEADPGDRGRTQRGVGVVHLGQVRPRGLEGAGLVVEHRSELELGQDISWPRNPARRLRVAAVSRTRGSPRAASPRASSSSARECASASSRAVRAHRAPRAAVPPHRSDRATRVLSAPRPRTGRLDRKPQGQALLEALTRDGTGHDRPVRPPCTSWQASRCASTTWPTCPLSGPRPRTCSSPASASPMWPR